MSPSAHDAFDTSDMYGVAEEKHSNSQNATGDNVIRKKPVPLLDPPEKFDYAISRISSQMLQIMRCHIFSKRLHAIIVQVFTLVSQSQ